jgi:hypothetical protein
MVIFIALRGYFGVITAPTTRRFNKQLHCIGERTSRPIDVSFTTETSFVNKHQDSTTTEASVQIVKTSPTAGNRIQPVLAESPLVSFVKSRDIKDEALVTVDNPEWQIGMML